MPLLSPPASALEIVTRLRQLGFDAYFCGGCVRDALMNRQPKDWDITTNAIPDQIERFFPHTIPVGKKFGVMIVVVDEQQYEVATFRADVEYRDGRRPDQIRFTSAKEDVKRRDFTINALLYDPESDQVIDHVGGVNDIEHRLLRTVGEPEQRFLEDHLRMLRAIRFAGRTGFKIEAGTIDAMRKMAGLARTVSGERTGEEVRRILTEGYASSAITLLEASGLLTHVLPEVACMRGVPQPPRFHPEGDVLEHTLIMLRLLDACVNENFAEAIVTTPAPELELTGDDRARGMVEASMTQDERRDAVKTTWSRIDSQALEGLAFSVLLHDIGKPETISYSDRIRFHEHDSVGAEMAVKTLERLKRPRKIAAAVNSVIGRHIHLANMQHMRKAKLRRWLQEEDFVLHLELHRLDCESSHRKLANYEFGYRAWQDECAREPEPEPLITGKDLIALGIPPGPRMGEILTAVQDAGLEGAVATSAEALDLASRLWKS